MTDGNSSATPREAAAALLDWYALAGIDTILGEAPRDRFAETAALQAARARPAPPPPAPPPEEPPPRASAAAAARPAVAVPDDVAVAQARDIAARAQSLDALRAGLMTFQGCNLRLTAKNTVFGDGDPAARVMLIGEAPGREEDIAGVPFVGRSGQLLNRMLAAIGIARETMWITNTVPWRPPGNRPPTPAETEICLPFVARQIELVRPKLLICLGSPATKAILRNEEGILRLRGKWLSYAYGPQDAETLPAIPMLHPAYLLRQPAQKKLAWRDLLAVRAKLDELGETPGE
ncbi:uracil-DNA glycosylase [Aureimonas endophytica]|uniref:Type-4 uracil-DNA glycosylase n=1 Tax=Aureimonas endophytica TaxID=2027858 RepID=A0A916ZFF2_9HYPH|nr:uracil-DNA glycosylase [Aureimonas endophytica]GGD93186.1 uracil-DNA glycosylase [Aureimonas endophytica]